MDCIGFKRMRVPLLTFLIVFCFTCKVAECDSRPNVLFLIIDDFRPALGSYGEQVITPNMDQLAAQSIRFTDAHAQQALCAPSRISLLTSRRPDSTLLWDFRSGYWRDVAGNFTTLPQHFKENGYYTVSSGKVFHKGACSNFTDDYPLSWSVPPFWPTTKREKGSKYCPGPDGTLHYYTMCPVNVTLMPKETLPDIETSDYAISVLQSLSLTRKKGRLNKGKHALLLTAAAQTPHLPFFLAVGYYKPHLPFRYPERFKDLYPIETVRMAKNPFFTDKLPPVAWEHWKDVRQGEDIPLSRSVPDYFEPMPHEYHVGRSTELVFAQRLMRQAYFATTSYIDHEVGRVLSSLEEEGLADNTIVALLGDHGWQLGEHQEWSKYSNFAAATQVPLIFHVPGVTDTARSRHRRKFPLIDPFNLPHSNHHHHTATTRTKISLTGECNHCRLSTGFSTDVLTELVDVFPTLAELAGLQVPPLCPSNTTGVAFCTEGISLVPVIHKTTDHPDRVNFKRWKNATFSQYPRPTFHPSHKTNTPALSQIEIMGYSMRTKKYRYAEWLPFNNTSYWVNWSSPLARELYAYSSDPLEDFNVAEMVGNARLVQVLSHQLRENWRQALPVFGEDIPITSLEMMSVTHSTQTLRPETYNTAAKVIQGAILNLLLAFLIFEMVVQINMCDLLF